MKLLIRFFLLKFLKFVDVLYGENLEEENDAFSVLFIWFCFLVFLLCLWEEFIDILMVGDIKLFLFVGFVRVEGFLLLFELCLFVDLLLFLSLKIGCLL